MSDETISTPEEQAKPMSPDELEKAGVLLLPWETGRVSEIDKSDQEWSNDRRDSDAPRKVHDVDSMSYEETAALGKRMNEMAQAENEAKQRERDGEPAAEGPSVEAADEQPRAPRVRNDLAEDDVVFEHEGKQISAKEAKLGFMRTRDYTQKRQVESAIAKDAARALDDAMVVLGAIESQFPEMSAEIKAERQRFQNEQNELRARQNQITAADWVEKSPRWKGDARLAVEGTLIAAQVVSKQYGFTEKEIMGVADPRIFDLMIDAAEYHRLLKAQGDIKSKMDAPTSKITRPRAKSRYGNSGGPSDAEIGQARARLKQTGDPRDAAFLLGLQREAEKARRR